jgi:non-ribosomal peptide synthetase component F
MAVEFTEMTMSTIIVFTTRTGTPEPNNTIGLKIKDLTDEGKTTGLVKTLTEPGQSTQNIVVRYWRDQDAAQEWVDFINTVPVFTADGKPHTIKIVTLVPLDSTAEQVLALLN